MALLKTIVDTFKGRKPYTTRILNDFGEIMSITRHMLEITVNELKKPTNDPSVKEEIYKMDQQVNDVQQGIRRQIVEHISLAPQDEPNISLILMSVVKDAERLGDLSKNLFEVAELLERPLDWDQFNGYFGGLFERLLKLHTETAEAFSEFDIEKAKDLIEKEKQFKQDCNALIWNLAKQSELKTNWAVCYGLMARHISRISGNLLNVCTAVVMPVESLDIFDESDPAQLDF